MCKIFLYNTCFDSIDIHNSQVNLKCLFLKDTRCQFIVACFIGFIMWESKFSDSTQEMQENH